MIDLRRKAFKSQGEQKDIEFKGIIKTYGVDISVLKQMFESFKGSSSGYKVAKGDEDDYNYVGKQSKEELMKEVGNRVLIDRDRRDPLFCMHESSTLEKQSRRNKISKVS